MLAARGYVVLYTNPRGSTGYGDDFAGQLFRAWGKHDFPDLMAAVDWAIAQGYVDEQRLGVLGGSYGGFMTNWVISHTTRFKAAVTQRCVSNMYSTFGTDDIFFASRRADDRRAAVGRAGDLLGNSRPSATSTGSTTPLLIEHQEHDFRCPIEQAEQLFTALKRRGKIVEFVPLPRREPRHVTHRPAEHRIERLNRICEWFDRYV